MTQATYDIAVIGGGLAGATLACALADTNYSVALVEAQPFAAELDANKQQRNIAIAWGTRQLFNQLNLWADMEAAAAPIRHLHVSQRGYWGTVKVHAADYQLPALGYVLPNTAILSSIRTQLQAMPHVDVIAPARFKTLHHQPDCVDLELDNNGQAQTISARLVVGADGARSSVRQALDISAQIDNYHQSAVVTTVNQSYAHGDMAYERFTPAGPVAVLPRGQDSCAVIWTLPTAEAERVKALADQPFIDELQQAFGHRLGKLYPASARGAFPLYRVLAKQAYAQRAVLIGNAGHFLHPAAAQGFNLSIRDVLLLAAMLKEQGGDPGDLDRLQAWAAAREPDQLRVANFTDKIVRLFSNNYPIGAARAAGLYGLSLLPSIKHDMARRSMGLASASL